MLFLSTSLCQKHVHCPASCVQHPAPGSCSVPEVAVLCGRGAVVPAVPLLCSEMSCTIEKALADAKALVERLREHDSAAEALIEQTTALNKRVEAMKQVCSPALLAPGNSSIYILWVLRCSTEGACCWVNPVMHTWCFC